MYSPIQQYVLNLVSKRDYTIGQVKQKLLERGYAIQDIDNDLQLLIDRKWLDDGRVAENIVIRYSDSRGRQWVRQKMMQKQISPEIINKVLTNYQQGQESNHIFQKLKRKVASKYKIDDWSNLDIQLKARVVSYLNRNGFSNAFEILSTWQSE